MSKKKLSRIVPTLLGPPKVTTDYFSVNISKTFWNGEPCEARKVRGTIVDSPDFPKHWAKPLIGQERDAVEVIYDGHTFYIDDEQYDDAPHTKGYPGWGWAKVTSGHGSPTYGHRGLSLTDVVDRED